MGFSIAERGLGVGPGSVGNGSAVGWLGIAVAPTWVRLVGRPGSWWVGNGSGAHQAWVGSGSGVYREWVGKGVAGGEVARAGSEGLCGDVGGGEEDCQTCFTCIKRSDMKTRLASRLRGWHMHLCAMPQLQLRCARGRLPPGIACRGRQCFCCVFCKTLRPLPSASRG